MRQMWMEMESPDALQEIESIRLGINFDGGCGPVRHFRRPKSKLIGHGNTQITKQRLGEAAQALLPSPPTCFHWDADPCAANQN